MYLNTALFLPWLFLLNCRVVHSLWAMVLGWFLKYATTGGQAALAQPFCHPKVQMFKGNEIGSSWRFRLLLFVMWRLLGRVCWKGGYPVVQHGPLSSHWANKKQITLHGSAVGAFQGVQPTNHCPFLCRVLYTSLNISCVSINRSFRNPLSNRN